MMKAFWLMALAAVVLSGTVAGNEAEGADKNPVVVIKTSMGTIKAELWPDKAPKTVENFLSYVDKKFYDGLIFHRVIKEFMIQGGGFDPKMREKEGDKPITNEARADVSNKRGTLAMARTNAPHSATNQFFINLVDNASLNHRNKTMRGWGYCVFGKVIEGMDVVDKIAKVQTGTRGPFRDVPTEPVVIQSIRRGK
jgi:cyclophilin family peptidyl-prolyl cis-trans isomerase